MQQNSTQIKSTPLSAYREVPFNPSGANSLETEEKKVGQLCPFGGKMSLTPTEQRGKKEIERGSLERVERREDRKIEKDVRRANKGGRVQTGQRGQGGGPYISIQQAQLLEISKC